MKFGIFFLLQSPEMRPATALYGEALEQAELADQLGFDHIWIAEHHFTSWGYAPSPLVLATALAQRTNRIRIGTGVLVLPLHHPLRVAEEIAMTDVLAGGRLDVGIGRGYQIYEFDRLGVSLEESRQRYEETLEIILRALSEQTFSYQGRYYEISPTTLIPRPVQTPHPPIWTVVQSQETLRFTVRRGYSCLLGGSLSALRQTRALFEQALAEVNGKGPAYVGIHKQVYVTDNEADARAQLDHAYWNLRMVGHLRAGTQRVENGRAIAEPLPQEPTPEELLRESVLFGTPEQVAERLWEYHEVIGMNYVNCSFSFGSLPQARVLRSMELFATKVMPQFRAVGSPLVGSPAL